MAYKLKTDLGKQIYGLRKSTVEPVIGIIKETLGFRQFSLPGAPRRVRKAGDYRQSAEFRPLRWSSRLSSAAWCCRWRTE